MKRLLCIGVSLLLVTIFLAIAGNAQHDVAVGDSSNISEDILAQLPLEEGDRVVRIYNISILSDFSLNDNIDDLLQNFDPQVIYAVESITGERNAYGFWGGVCVQMRHHDGFYVLLETYLNNSAIELLDPNIVVEQSYYFMGETNYNGSAIYYKTNLGDYVYYRCMKHGFNGEYLFTSDAFFSAIKLTCQMERELYKEPVVGGSGNDELESYISAYKIGSDHFDPNAEFPSREDQSNQWLVPVGITLGVCLLSAATIAALRFRRKKQAQA